RARVQEQEVSTRLDRLLAKNPFVASDPTEVLEDLRERSTATHRIFTDLLASSAGGSASAASAADSEVTRRFEAQLSSRLLILQQESLADAFRLGDFSNQRIDAAQRRVVIVIAAGLLLIALTTCAAAWLVNRNVLAPIARLEQATRE